MPPTESEKRENDRTLASQRERYHQAIQNAQAHYQQHVVPPIQRRLERVRRWGPTLARLHAEEGETGLRVVALQNTVTEELIQACLALRYPAYRLGNLTGQTDYFQMWLHLWTELVNSYPDLLPPPIRHCFPPLYTDWSQDSIIKRAFTRAIAHNQGSPS